MSNFLYMTNLGVVLLSSRSKQVGVQIKYVWSIYKTPVLVYNFSRVQEIIKSQGILVRPKEARHQCSGQAPLPAFQPEHDPKGGSVAPVVICQDSAVFVG